MLTSGQLAAALLCYVMVMPRVHAERALGGVSRSVPAPPPCLLGAAFAPSLGRLGSLRSPTDCRPWTVCAPVGRVMVHRGVVAGRWAMSHALSKQQAQRNQELNEERKQRNLAIAARVANGELCPVVVSFSPAMRAQLRLAKRYKHTRIFVETHEVTSLAALHTALVREIPHPLAEVPRVAFELAVRPPAADSRVEAEEAEDSWQPGAPLALDQQLQDAYPAAQDFFKLPVRVRDGRVPGFPGLPAGLCSGPQRLPARWAVA